MGKDKTFDDVLEILVHKINISKDGFSGEQTVYGLYQSSADITEYIYNNFKPKETVC